MYLCYVDESGDGQLLDPAWPDAPPVMVIGGIILPDRRHQKSASELFALPIPAQRTEITEQHPGRMSVAVPEQPERSGRRLSP